MKTLKSLGIKVPRGAKGQFKTQCPICLSTGTREHPDDSSLSVNLDATDRRGRPCVFFHCHYCGHSGKVLKDGGDSEDEKITIEARPGFKNEIVDKEFKSNRRVEKYFADRKISSDIIALYGLGYFNYFFSKQLGNLPAIAFPFTKGGKVVNVQYQSFPDKSGHKTYRMIQGAELCFFGLDDMVEDGYVASKKLVIVEGMKDKLALREVGFKYVLSVPNGAPDLKTVDYSKALQYLDDESFQKILEHIEQVVIATDGDAAGKKLADELSTRIGVERCYRVEYPEGTKDFNDVLIKFDSDKVIETLLNAKPYPSKGEITVLDIKDKLFKLYETGITPGYSTGIKELDKIITIKPGYLYLVVGIPTIGKTEILDWLVEGLVERENIHATIFSPESYPPENHVAKFAQLYTRTPFGKPGDKNRITKKQLNKAADWLNEHVTWVMPEKQTNAELLRIFSLEVLKHGTQLAVIDPYNDVEMEGENEHNFIKKFLRDWRMFSRTKNVATLIVVHPTKLAPNEDGEYPIVTPYHLAGSSHWFNKSDFIISLWRSIKDERMPLQVHIQKAKVRQVGRSPAFECLKWYEDTGHFSWHPFSPEMPVDIEERMANRNNQNSLAKIAAVSRTTAKKRTKTRKPSRRK